MKRGVVALLVVVALALVGCGEDKTNQPAEISVSAAASLTTAFENVVKDFDDASVRFQFAGSDALAAQIEQGAQPDVFAAANTKLPQQLYEKGLVEMPVNFTTNKLVIAVPAGSGEIDSIDDLAGSGVKIAAGAESVPVGAYTRKVLGALPAEQRQAILANFRSEEPDVKGVVGKVATGSVDAGFVYQSDVDAADGKLVAVELPSELEPEVVYAAAVVKGSDQPAAGQAFVDFLLSPLGQKQLQAAGFGAAPKQ